MALKPLVKRLEAVRPNLSHQDLTSIILVVRLGEILHRSFYGSFLTLPLVSKLCDHLNIPDLFVEVEVFVMRWSFRQGQVQVSHRITFDYDMYTVFVMTNIARGVLNGSISPKEGLKLIRNHEQSHTYSKIEAGYRDFPTRAGVVPLMAATCATVFFGGTWYDLGFAAVCGLVGGIVASICTAHEQLTGVMDYVVAILTALISVASVTLFHTKTCFSAQVLGTLYWFFYRTAFVLSLYEMTNNQLMTGVLRFAQAALRSYGLAFGAIIGVWFSAYATDDRLDILLVQCSTRDGQISDVWFILLFPLAGIACLMQFRVSLRHFPVCLMVQAVAYGSQYLLGTVWKQLDFISNLIPTFLATVSSSVMVSILHHFQVSNLKVSRKKNDDDDDDDNNNIMTNYSMEQPTAPCTPQSVFITEEGEIVESSLSLQSNDTHNSRLDLDKRHGQIPEMSREPRMRGSNLPSLQDVENSNQQQQHNSDMIGLADASAGRVSSNTLTLARSDTWFCLMPALYLLVPGSKIFQRAFTLLLQSVFQERGGEHVEALGSSLLLIGLGQVIGLRLGFVTLWACNAAWKWVRDRLGYAHANKVERETSIDSTRASIRA